MTMDDESSTFPVDSGSGKVNEALCQGFAALKTQDDAPFLKTEGEHSKPTYTEGKSITRHQNSFSILCLELDNNLDYSPPDEDVQSAVKTITSVIRIVAHSLATDDFQVEIFSSSMLQHYPDISDIVRERTVSEFVRDIDSMQENHVPFLKMALSWALWSWTFYPSTSPALPVPDNAKTRSELLLDFYKEITLPERRFFRILNETSANQPRGELKLLQGLYSTAWSSLMKGRPLILQSIIRTEAEELAQRLLRMLSLYIKRSESSDDRRPLKTSEEWIKTTKNGRSRFKLIVELFASCIKLRDSLKMSRYNYELYYPTSSEIQFVEVDARPDGNYHHINFYFAPAILQYESNESNTFHDTETVGGILLGRQNVARMTDEQRTESRVVCPAVVGLG
jgi:hypothetical protein